MPDSASRSRTIEAAAPPVVAFTVDLEPDCPPYLSTGFRGVSEGLPALLDLLAQLDVPATFFTTGEVATRYPRVVEQVVTSGHELACHGMTHTAFTSMDRRAAHREIEESARILRQFGPVTSFRAPYLKFPDGYLGLLEDAAFTLDSSHATYKAAYHTSRYRRAGPSPGSALRRVPASITSSVLRLPAWLRDPWLATLRSPVVLFVHPWECVDLTNERLRLDCRFKTGQPALAAIGDVLRSYTRRGATFARMRELRSIA